MQQLESYAKQPLVTPHQAFRTAAFRTPSCFSENNVFTTFHSTHVLFTTKRKSAVVSFLNTRFYCFSTSHHTRSSLPLVKKWLAVFKAGQEVFGQYLSGEQQGNRYSNYNFRLHNDCYVNVREVTGQQRSESYSCGYTRAHLPRSTVFSISLLRSRTWS
jgi:hypothetical protein